MSSDGHVSQAPDRLASARARRDATTPDVRCAGTASPVPKYISSGVCPRNAECGSTRLCSVFTRNALEDYIEHLYDAAHELFGIEAAKPSPQLNLPFCPT